MNKYVIQENNKLSVIITNKFVPNNTIGILPYGVNKDDYKYLKADVDQWGQYTIYVDLIAKAADIPNVQAEKEAEAMSNLRRIRNILLAESDWTQIPDAPLTVNQISDWAIYRQELRDLPSTVIDPLNPIYPSKP